MITILVVIYLVGFLVTSALAAYQTGVEQCHMNALRPEAYAVNWVNNFFQGLLWIGHWCCVIAKKRTGSVSKAEAAAYFGIPPDKIGGIGR